MSKVSVIIPHTGDEAGLEKTLASVLSQSLADIEAICVVPEGVETASGALAQASASDSRVRTVCLSGGSAAGEDEGDAAGECAAAGTGAAFNAGLDAAEGDYVVFLPEGATLLEGALEALYGTAVQDGLDWAKCDRLAAGPADGADGADEAGDVSATGVRVPADPSDTRYGELLVPAEDQSAAMLDANVCAAVYRRGFLMENGIRFQDRAGCREYDMVFFFETMVHARKAMVVRADGVAGTGCGYPVPASRDTLFDVNIEFDAVKNLLLHDQDMYQNFRQAFSWQKFRIYRQVMEGVSNEFKTEFVRRMGAELDRGYRNFEFNDKVFSHDEWEEIWLLMHDPDTYLKRWRLDSQDTGALIETTRHLENTKADLERTREELKNTRAELGRARNRIKEIEESTTYKVGKKIMYIPTTLKDRGNRS